MTLRPTSFAPGLRPGFGGHGRVIGRADQERRASADAVGFQKPYLVPGASTPEADPVAPYRAKAVAPPPGGPAPARRAAGRAEVPRGERRHPPGCRSKSVVQRSGETLTLQLPLSREATLSLSKGSPKLHAPSPKLHAPRVMPQAPKPRSCGRHSVHSPQLNLPTIKPSHPAGGGPLNHSTTQQLNNSTTQPPHQTTFTG